MFLGLFSIYQKNQSFYFILFSRLRLISGLRRAILVDQSRYILRQVVSERVYLNRWLILVLVMTTNPKTVIRDCRLFGDRLTSSNNQSKI